MSDYGKLNNAYLHHHELELKITSRPFECGRCREYGLHTRYQCIRQPSCPFKHHKACAEAIRTPRIQHDLFPNCEFVLRHQPLAEGVRCDACARPVRGFHFHCARRDLHLHPNCARLPTRWVEGGVMLRLRDIVSSECSYCGRRSYGDGKRSWCYVSEGGGEVRLHVGYVTDMLLQAWERENCTSNSVRRGPSSNSSVPGQKTTVRRGPSSNSRSVLVPRQATTVRRGPSSNSRSVLVPGQATTVRHGPSSNSRSVLVPGQTTTVRRGPSSNSRSVLVPGQTTTVGRGPSSNSRSVLVPGQTTTVGRGPSSNSRSVLVPGQATTVRRGPSSNSRSVLVPGQPTTVRHGPSSNSRSVLVPGQATTVRRGPSSNSRSVLVPGQPTTVRHGPSSNSRSVLVPGQTTTVRRGPSSNSRSVLVPGQTTTVGRGPSSNSRSVLVPGQTTTAPPKLQVSLRNGGNCRNWRAAGISAVMILKIVVSVVAAVFGDPTLLVVNLISAVW